MSNEIFFVAGCPKCKRRNEFDIQQLGQTVSCRHCSASMSAKDSQSNSAAELDPIQYWIEFTESGAAAGAKFEYQSEFPRAPRPK